MSQNTESGSDDSDWFSKDEDELLKNLPSKSENISLAYSSTEYITDRAEAAGYHFEAASSVSAARGGATARIATATLRKLTHSEPLDTFLFVFTQKPDFFVDQVASNDALDRVILYIRIFTQLCELEVPGFHVDLLRSFASNEKLLDHFPLIATKLFRKSYKSMWTDEKRVDEIVHDMQTLLLQTHHLGFLTQQGLEVMLHIRKLIMSSDASHIAQRAVCLELAEHLERALRVERAIVEIYPTLEELGQSCDDVEQETSSGADGPEFLHYESVVDYIDIHKRLLRENFTSLLRTHIGNIKEIQTFKDFPRQTFYAEDVRIVFNDQFLKDHRHQMLFVEVLGCSRRKTNKNPYKQIQTGALLCLTTSYEFKDLILANVTCADSDVWRAGFIGIEIERQYNIGNVYGKSLIAFETPAFFEPYHNVYNFLSTCSVADFPMKDYIVFGETNGNVPGYLQEQTTYTYNKEKFKPLQDQPPKKLPLDVSQKAAYSNALKENFCLIQGPPGTGKSKLSMHLLKTLIENRPKPIVLITSSNEALDNFLMKFSDFTRQMVRFGDRTPHREITKYNAQHVASDKYLVNPHLKRLYYITDLEFKEQFQRLRLLQTEFNGSEKSYEQILAAQHSLRAIKCKLQTIRILFQYPTLRNESVIAMTTACAAKTNFLFRLLKSSIVIFEDAGEIIESHVVACLTPYTKHVIMIGDHHSQSCQINVSFFERMIRLNMKRPILKIQYRMRPSITDLICPVFCEELHNDESVENYPLIRKMRKNVYFLEHNQTKLANRLEMNKIGSLAEYLIIKAEYTAEDIVILSTNAAQNDRMKSNLKKDEKFRQIRMDTVDSFKGLEANIVLLSLAPTVYKHGQIGFSSKETICMALSRAKQGLYIVGNLDLMETCTSTWSAIRQKLEAQDAIGNEFPYEK